MKPRYQCSKDTNGREGGSKSRKTSKRVAFFRLKIWIKEHRINANYCVSERVAKFHGVITVTQIEMYSDKRRDYLLLNLNFDHATLKSK